MNLHLSNKIPLLLYTHTISERSLCHIEFMIKILLLLYQGLGLSHLIFISMHTRLNIFMPQKDVFGDVLKVNWNKNIYIFQTRKLLQVWDKFMIKKILKLIIWLKLIGNNLLQISAFQVKLNLFEQSLVIRFVQSQ